MAIRPVYIVSEKKPYYKIENIEFKFYTGFSKTQKQKSIKSLHSEYNNLHKEKRILEISTKSSNLLGIQLSAFNLLITTSNRQFSVENAFQSSKIFENGGPYTELLMEKPGKAKRDIRLRESGKLIAFEYFGIRFPLEPKDYFYNWLYVNTLNLNKKLAKEILQYDSFSDIEFNPKKSINCQAKAAAIFVGLNRQELLDEALESKKNFLRIVYGIK